MTEAELSTDIANRLAALTDAGRAVVAKEVRMLCFTPANRVAPVTLRIDYVVCLDGLLIGIEIKKPPEHAADLGRDLTQCAQYASGVIGAATVDRVPPQWVGKALFAVFLATSAQGCTAFILEHFRAAHRLYGPQNVGFLNRQCRHDDCFELKLCAERAWSKEWGWHRGIVRKTARTGNGSTTHADTSSVTFPPGTEW
jgi:hypothetical protein